MREIKFRVYAVYEMEYFGLGDTVPYYYPNEDSSAVKYEPVMQFTGLLDKNGKEIYEGDVIETYGIDGRLRWVFEYTEEESGIYGGFSPEPINHDFSSVHNNMENCEIIGNIYENQDLLNN